MAIQSMQDLMLEELREIYSAERLALRAYPRLRKTIKTPSLKEAVERHTEQTKEQVERLGKVFELMDARARGKTCHAMEGLLEEAQSHMENDLSPELLEVMLLADLQKVEHFEIAAYGSARAHAEALGLTEAVELLDQTLNEEKETDELLNRLALEEINPQAVNAAMEAEGEEEEEEGEEQEGGGGQRASGRSGGGSKARGGQSAGRQSGGAQSAGGQSGGGQSGGGQSGGGQSGGADDLKSREYRDKQGNVHHHTRTSSAQGSR